MDKRDYTPKKRAKKRIRTMDLILIFIGVVLVAFTIDMRSLYRATGAIPDTLCTCVFGLLGGECGAMAWIRTTKERHRERSYELHDREDQRKYEKEQSDAYRNE